MDNAEGVSVGPTLPAMSRGAATVVLGPPPPELADWLARRKALGQDLKDEVWEGRYVVAPFAHGDHGIMQAEVALAIGPRAKRLGWATSVGFNLGEPDNFRVPDGGVHREPPRTLYVPTAELVVEVLSPDDQSFAKLDFYAGHGVRELLVVNGSECAIRCFALQDGQAERDRSDVLDVTMAELAAEVDWPGSS